MSDAVGQRVNSRQQAVKGGLQVRLRQVVAGAEAQVNVELMGQAQRLIGAIVGDLLQLADQIGNAGAQRTRNIVTQDQQLHHRFATDWLAIEAVVGFAGADRIEQGIQSIVFPHRIRVVGQLLILNQQQLGGGEGALYQRADADKAQRVVAQQRANHRPAKQMHPLFHPLEKAVAAEFAQPLLAQGSQLDSGGVDALPHLGRQTAAHRVRIVPRHLHAAVNTAGVVAIEGKKVEQVAHGKAGMARLKQLVGHRQIQRQRQIPRLLAVPGDHR